MSNIRMTPEDLSTIEHAGRRCAICNTGRQWKRLRVAHPEGGDPVVLCPACEPRFEQTMKAAAEAKAKAAVVEPPAKAPASEGATTSTTHPNRPARPPRRKPAEDRLKRALRELPPGEHSTKSIAKAAGLNHAKTLARLHALEASGDVQQVGKHWSTERPASDLEAAFDRLQARTGNLRIIRERQKVS
jgi:hypothetical protein